MTFERLESIVWEMFSLFRQKNNSNFDFVPKIYGSCALPKMSNSVLEEKFSCSLSKLLRRNSRIHSCSWKRTVCVQMPWMWAICSKIEHSQSSNALSTLTLTQKFPQRMCLDCSFDIHLKKWKVICRKQDWFSRKHLQLKRPTKVCWRVIFLWKATWIGQATLVLLPCPQVNVHDWRRWGRRIDPTDSIF